MKTPLTIAAVAVSLLLTAGCGGGSKPSADELSTALSTTLNPNGELYEAGELADCIAEKYLESDVSAETLQAIVDGDEAYFDTLDDSDERNEILSIAMSTSCFT